MMKLTDRTLLAAAAAALLAVACSSQPTGAPVVDLAPLVAPAPKPPIAQQTPIPGARTGTYVVRPGDTLYSIALEQGVDYRDLAQWNNLDDPTKISVGQTLLTAAPEARGGAVVTVGAARGSGRVESRPLGATAVARQGGGDGSTKTEPKALRLPYSKDNLALLSKGEPERAPAAQPVSSAPQPAAAARARPPPAAAGGIGLHLAGERQARGGIFRGKQQGRGYRRQDRRPGLRGRPGTRDVHRHGHPRLRQADRHQA